MKERTKRHIEFLAYSMLILAAGLWMMIGFMIAGPAGMIIGGAAAVLVIIWAGKD